MWMANAERKRLTAMGLLVALALSALLCSAAGSAAPTAAPPAATTSHRHLTPVVKSVATHLSGAARARIGVVPPAALASAAVAAVLLSLGIVRAGGPGRPLAAALRLAHARAPPLV
jgi:hypothetical protein